MPDLDRVPDDWRARGFSCDIWVDPPGQVWADFVHSVDELVMPIEGEMEVEMANRRVRPAVGEEVFIPAGVSHTVRNLARGRSRWYYGYRRVEKSAGTG